MDNLNLKGSTFFLYTLYMIRGLRMQRLYLSVSSLVNIVLPALERISEFISTVYKTLDGYI